MLIMNYQDYWDYRDKATHMISYIDGHDNDPRYEIALYADFSNNQEVAITPILCSTNLIGGIFKQKEVTFNYFNFVPSYLYHEVDLPVQYNNISLAQFNGRLNVEYTYDSVKGMFSTISFDTQNLIQIYAGIDNIPYSSDDIFVYAPNYWERVIVKLEIK